MTALSAAVIGSTGAILTGLLWSALIVVSDMWSRSRRLSDHSQRAMLPLDREWRDPDLTTSIARSPSPACAAVDTTAAPTLQVTTGHPPRPVDGGAQSPRLPRPISSASRSHAGLLLTLGGSLRRIA